MVEHRDIEDLLVWAFREQQVEHYVQTLRGASRGPVGLLGGSVGQVLLLGTRVDNSVPGAKWLGARCSDDAVTIYEAVMALPAEAWVEVIKHARTATEPDWHPEGPGQWVVPLDRNGEPKRLWRDPSRRRGDLGPAPAELFGTNPLLVETARATYRLWHTALIELVPMVNRDLEAFRASPPRRLPAPWTAGKNRAA